MLSAWNKTSMLWDGFSGCCNPSHIAILSDGSFVTSEKGLTRVKVHGANGALKAIVATPEQFEEGTVGLDIAIDSQDRIYIADPERGAIRVFEHK
jgi:sugar lactone lactonase YvrE